MFSSMVVDIEMLQNHITMYSGVVDDIFVHLLLNFVFEVYALPTPFLNIILYK